MSNFSLHMNVLTDCLDVCGDKTLMSGIFTGKYESIERWSEGV